MAVKRQKDSLLKGHICVKARIEQDVGCNRPEREKPVITMEIKTYLDFLIIAASRSSHNKIKRYMNVTSLSK